MSVVAPTRLPAGVRQLGVLSVVLAALFVIPSRLTFGPLGGAGSPTQIVGMALFVLWLLRRALGLHSRPTPVHWALAAFAGSVLASYLVAALRPVTGPETSAADRGLLAVVGWCGLFLTAAEGLRRRRDLDVFLRRLVLGGGVVAVIGLLQFVTKQQLTNFIVVPGLSDTSPLALGARNGFTRPTGTTIHPIEFGAVLTMVLPLALHFAITDPLGASLLRRWWPVAAIAVAVPLSISRSAIISAAVVLLTVLPTWPRSTRRRAYGALMVLGIFVYLLVPGLLGTITGLFRGISGDTSTQSRTDSYALAGEFITRSPVLGRGFLTFLTNYRILDNQYLGLLIELGFVGLLATLGLFFTAMRSAWRYRRQATDPVTRSLAQALLASIAAMTFSMAVFDAVAFPMAMNLLFLLLGSVAALVATPRYQDAWAHRSR